MASPTHSNAEKVLVCIFWTSNSGAKCILRYRVKKKTKKYVGFGPYSAVGTFKLHYEVLNVFSSTTYMFKLIVCVWVLTLAYKYS